MRSIRRFNEFDPVTSHMDFEMATRADFRNIDMPELNRSIEFIRVLSPEERENLSHGFIPQCMEDRWFSYMEGNRLYMHRSWTGFCTFILELGDGDRHTLIINCDPGQYEGGDDDFNTELVNRLIDRWILPFRSGSEIVTVLHDE